MLKKLVLYFDLSKFTMKLFYYGSMLITFVLKVFSKYLQK